MKIEVGKHAGFCRGVKEAVDKAFALSREEKKEIYTDGELIHNPQTIRMLESRNVKVLKDKETLKKIEGKTVIIRAHGVPPERRNELKKKANNLKNFTCIDVARVQSTIKKWSNKGFSIIIFGKKEHPEVIGLLGYAKEGFIVYKEEDIDKLPNLKKVFLVSQTTMDQEAFSKISILLKQKFRSLEIENTICSATELRQNEVKELAKRNDCIIVIGGKKSSNSKRLYELSMQFAKTFFIENVEELKEIDFKGIKKLGITAGASTPDWLITEFIEEIQKLSQKLLPGFFRNILSFSLHSNFIAALGVFVLSFAVAENFNTIFSFNIGLLVSLYYLSMSLMNSYTNRFSFKIDNPGSYRFISRYRYVFLSLFILSIIVILYIAFRFGQNIMILTMFSILLGIVYNLSFLPLQGLIRKIMSFREWDLLALKSVVLAFAVTFLLNGLYILHTMPDFWLGLFEDGSFLYSFGFYFSVYYVFILMFTRQVLFEIKSAQTDKISGVSSILNIMNKKNVIKILRILPIILVFMMIVGVFAGHYPLGNMKYIISVIYTYFLLSLALKKEMFHKRNKFELIIESNIYIAGIIAFL